MECGNCCQKIFNGNTRLQDSLTTCTCGCMSETCGQWQGDFVVVDLPDSIGTKFCSNRMRSFGYFATPGSEFIQQ